MTAAALGAFALRKSAERGGTLVLHGLHKGFVKLGKECIVNIDTAEIQGGIIFLEILLFQVVKQNGRVFPVAVPHGKAGVVAKSRELILRLVLYLVTEPFQMVGISAASKARFAHCPLPRS